MLGSAWILTDSSEDSHNKVYNLMIAGIFPLKMQQMLFERFMLGLPIDRNAFTAKLSSTKACNWWHSLWSDIKL